MAVSGTTTFTMTRDELITDALLEIGGVALGGTPTADQITHASRRLNTMLKAWQGERIFLYAVATGTVDTVAAQNYVTYPTGVRRILHMWVTVDGTDTALNKISQEEYDSVTTKTTPTIPYAYYIDEADGKIYFLGVPNAVYTISYRAESILDDMTSATDNVDLPQPALDFIMKYLASELAVPYGLAPDRLTTTIGRAREAKKAYLAHYNQEFNARDIKKPRGVLIT